MPLAIPFRKKESFSDNLRGSPFLSLIKKSGRKKKIPPQFPDLFVFPWEKPPLLE
jgi:hypothetical protein